jgi:hypothetical protein
MESEYVYRDCFCIKRKSKTTHASQICQGQVNICNEMCTFELKVSDSIVKVVNKTVSERLQTKLLDGQIQVKMC